MKYPTDEEIEKHAREIAEGFGGSFSRTAYELTGEAANWARDQQPKLKTLEWFQTNRNTIKAQTPIAVYWVYHSMVNGKDKFTWNFQYLDDKFYAPQDCDSEEHGKQLAQADYEKRINELYL